MVKQLESVGKIIQNRKHKQFFDTISLKKLERIAYVKQIISQTNNPKIVLNAILWILKSGARWRDLPPYFGNWNSIYHTFRRF